jgi:hypothetical protein
MRTSAFGFNTPTVGGTNESKVLFIKNQNQSSGFTITIPEHSRALWIDIAFVSGTPTVSIEWTVSHVEILGATLITAGNPISIDITSIIQSATQISVSVSGGGEVNLYLAYIENYDI